MASAFGARSTFVGHDEQEEQQELMRRVVQQLERYPILTQAMLGLQLGLGGEPLAQARDALLTAGVLYSIAPRRGTSSAYRYLLTEYLEPLRPFVAPVFPPITGYDRTTKRLIERLFLFPIVNIALLQSSLNTSSGYFQRQLEQLCEDGVVGKWRPVTDARRKDRYYLLRYAATLEPFFLE
jgi:hypothetical protein